MCFAIFFVYMNVVIIWIVIQHTHTRTHAHMHTRTHTRTHARTHTYIYNYQNNSWRWLFSNELSIVMTVFFYKFDKVYMFITVSVPSKQQER